jgi:hypothetical protein
MALQMTISTKSGLTIENAYVKVSDNLNLNRSSNSRLGYFRLEVYKDTDSRTSGKAQIKDPDFKRFIVSNMILNQVIMQLHKLIII